ncbi:hypothetical protein Glittering_13 [Bacillus phage Glittering]|uniref:Uncharacterized protein n=1 Tax=Bacillus phage Glittering TaxID=2884421 RepID=U5PTC3_9CAUD|nr:hypothetical protein Glittering_13 [Bacillus phage Glittering]AGY47200.1 hypothetical protein Glittering_13 [Bacillus phage Glittering]
MFNSKTFTFDNNKCEGAREALKSNEQTTHILQTVLSWLGVHMIGQPLFNA